MLDFLYITIKYLDNNFHLKKYLIIIEKVVFVEEKENYVRFKDTMNNKIEEYERSNNNYEN